MNKWIRETKRGLCAFLFVLTLIAQSVLPVYADTADAGNGSADADYTETAEAAWESGTTYSLDYFDRIAVNSVRGFLTIRTGDDFSIWLPDGWAEAPGFSVQDSILVVSGRKSGDAGTAKSGGSAVVIGEDEPGEGASGQSAGVGKTGAGSSEGFAAAGGTETAAVMHEIVITIPAGIGLDTLRVAMESGDLFLSYITANSVTIQSGGGNLILRDVSLGTVDIYTDAGEVSMAEGTFGTLNIGMGEGEVIVSSDDVLSECRMELKTGDGEITVSGTAEGGQYMQPGNGKKSLTVQVVSGDIRVDG